MSTHKPLRGAAPSGPEDMRNMPRTMVDFMRQRAGHRRDRLAFSFSRDGEERENHRVTYRQLDARAQQIAAELQQHGAAGECVLVFCPPGVDFIVSYFGCLYAGAIAVPVHPPMRDHLVPRVEAIIADMQPGFAVTTAEVYQRIKPTVDGLAGGGALRWCIVDEAAHTGPWTAPEVDPSTTAMVQYTSGSTSAPKGVVLSHGNLVHNMETIRQAWGSEFDNDGYGVFWLPPYHDMGLIGGLLSTLYVGGSCVLMPPNAFIKGPMRWLNAMSRHHAVITAAPNFAYDLCAELSTPEQREALDLSNWTAALCGAEPVRTATLDGFAAAFAPSGFRPEAFLPVYGLAEATLLVSGGSESPLPLVRRVQRTALRNNQVVDAAADDPHAATLIGCGRPQGGQRVIIVDPDTRRPRQPDQVGEIWVAGPSVAQGYWGRPEQSEETFSATLADTGEGPFLRTGDLGFLRDGQLFVTGRHKDLIIIRGNNFYPTDIELTVQDCHPALMRGRGAVFSVEPEPGAAEQLVVAQEVNHATVGEDELTAMIDKIRTAITERYGIRTHAVVLVEPIQIPTTSSGKVQRSACRQQFLDGALPVVAEWRAPSLETAPDTEPDTEPDAASETQVATPPAEPAAQPSSQPGAAQITDWLINRLAHELEIPASEIDPARPFAFYGLDSIHAVRLTTALERWLGGDLSPTLAYEYPTVDALAGHLAHGESHPVATADDGHADPRPQVADEPIAIVGIGCRFPGADGPAAFWELLSRGVDATSEVPPERWDADAFYNPDPSVPGTAVTRRGGFLRGIDKFDHQFFGISPREAAQMDPQQRLLLEVAWEALEDAGQVPDRLAGTRAGVFVGISTNDYGAIRQGHPQLIDAYSGTGNALSIAANRLSYVFDFRGPSMAIDTACSSSLVAVDLACRSLRGGECTLALAGGVNIMLSPALAINFTKARVMAPDGRCKTFDADAEGYVRAEGAGIVVLKPLSRALADNDPIYAVIRGTATNQDGRTNGLIAPSERSQEEVLTAAYRHAGLSPGVVQYVEAHGTGTALGDAIEAKALGAVLSDGRAPGSPCLVGSVKTNIGHLEAAAGVAGLIKVALALQHRQIPPSLNFTEPNPHIPFDSLPLDVVRGLTPWPDHGGRAVAGVSSFGFGGTNAHVVLTEAPQARISSADDDTASACAELLPLSARSPEALTALVGEYEMALFSGVALGDLCYTAGARRGHHDYRLCVVGDSPATMFESLAAYRQGESRAGLSVGHCRPGRPPAVTFVFSGQGSQWRAMGQRLAAEEPVFRDALHECDRAMRRYLGRSVLDELNNRGDAKLTDISLIQPAIFAVQVALAALWRSWGVEPAAVVGHSMGEVAAAHVAGALSLPDAARVIWARAHTLNRVRGRGAMLVAEVSQAEARELIAGRQDRVAIAANNSHRSTVLSGDQTVLADLMAQLENRDRFCRWIDVDAASHSPRLNALTTELRGMLCGLHPSAPTVPLYSSVTGELTDQPLDPGYWAKNLCSPVQFSSALRRLLDTGHDTFVEISPHPILLTAVREDAEDLGRDCTLLPSIRRDDDGRATVLGSLGALYTLGQPVAWEQIYPSGSRCISAPTYPWQRVHSWLDVGDTDRRGAVTHPGTQRAAGDLLPWRGPLRSAAHPETVLAEVQIGTGLLPALADHQVHRTAVLPVALLLGLVRSATTRAFGAADPVLREVTLHQMLEFTDGEPRTIQFVLHGDLSTGLSFECYRVDTETSKPAGPGRFVLLARGTVTIGGPTATGDGPDRLSAAQARCVADIPATSFYRSLADHDLQYGPKFQAVKELWRRDGEAIARLVSAGPVDGADELAVAVALDACFQTLGAALHEPAGGGTYLPTGLAELQTCRALADGVWCHAVLHEAADPGPGRRSTATGDVFLLDDDGEIVATARGLRMQHIAGAPTLAALRDRIYQLRWQPASLAPDAEVFHRPPKPGSWLILSDGSTVADTLRDHLESHAQTCVLVEPAPGLAGLERLGSDSYRLDPARPEQFRQLLTDAFDSERPPCRGVVHLWNLLAAAPSAHTTADALESATTAGALSVVYLLQALSVTGWTSSPRLWLVTRGAQVPDTAASSPDTQQVAVAQAPVWGIGRSIDHEHPELRCTCVDLPTGGGPEELRALFQEVWADSPELGVALRDHRRYVARLTRYRNVDAGAAAFSAIDAIDGFDPHASYLITGGLGALGGVVATWMVEHGARHLALMGRSAPSAAAQATVDRLRAAGAQVTVARGDVTQADQVAAVLESIGTSMPPLRGVVHAAGIVDVGAFAERLNERQLREVMAPKVQGAWNLHALTCDSDLDFFVMFSSAASILGSPGAANYGAANAFLDALAWHRRAEGRPALTINWGPWAELGMLTQSELHRRFTRYGVEAMPAAEYLRALSLLLAQPVTQAAVFDIDWARWRPGSQNPLIADLRVVESGDPAAHSPDGEPSGAATILYDALQHAAAGERQGLLEAYLRDLIAGKLGLAPARLDVQAPLNSLGVDSLITLELRIQVERELGIVVPVARLLDGPSVAGLASWLADQLSEATLPDRAQPPQDAELPPARPTDIGAATSSTGVDAFTQVPELSDDAVDELLRQVLAEQATHEHVQDGG